MLAKNKLQLLKIREHIHAIENEERYYIYNIETGYSIKINKKSKEYLDYIVENSIEYSKAVASDNDKLVYIVNKFKDLGIFNSDETKRNNKLSIILAITNICHLACTHCIFSCSSKVLPTYVDEKRLSRIISYHPDGIILSGGEPLMHPNIWSFVRLVKNHGIKVGIMTNATLLTKDIIRANIEYLDQVCISIDGYDDESVERVRGENVYAKVIECIHNLKDNNFNNISLSMVLTKENIGREDRFNEFCKELDVKPIIQMLFDEGRAKSIDGQKLEYEFNSIKKELCFNNCAAFEREIFINERGDIYPCAAYINEKYSPGSVFDFESTKEIFAHCSSQKFKRISPINNEHCMECVYRYICTDCVIPLRHWVLNDQEICCNGRKENIDKIIWGAENYDNTTNK